MQRLRAAEHGRQGLEGGADDIVLGLFVEQADPGRLAVEAAPQRAGVAGSEPVAHDLRPDTPRGAQLGDLLEKIIVDVEEEGQSRCKGVDIQAGVDRRLDVLDAVGECEGQFLQRGRTGFTYVVSAYGDGIELGSKACSELKGVNDQAH